MIVFSPDSIELLKRMVCVDTNRHQLSIGIVSGFSLTPNGGAIATDTEKLDLWELAAAHLGKDAVLDEGYPKAVGEFMAYGACYANQASTNHQPVSARVTIGSLSKQLAVYGDRTFSAVGTISSPLPFSRMALTPENAFGGPGFAENPYGKGFPAQGKSETGQTRQSLPNVEDPTQLIVSDSARPHPAGFWALTPDSPRRMRHLGTFDEAWKSSRWPHFPMDTDPAYFQAAPEDQQLNGYFAGDERIEIHNMHPQAPVIQTSLPSQRLRVLVARNGAAGEVEEYKANIDTVWLFVDALAGFQLFRSIIPAKDADGEDITHLYLAIESLLDAPLAFNLHAERFRRLMSGNEPDSLTSAAIMTEAGDVSDETNNAGVPLTATAVAAPADSLLSVDGQQIKTVPLEGVEDLGQTTQEIIHELDIESFKQGSDMATLPPEIASLLGLDDSKPQSELQFLLDMKSEMTKSNEQVREALKNTKFDDPKLMEILKDSTDPELADAPVFLQSAPSMIEEMMQEMEQGLDEAIEFELANPKPEPDEARALAAVTAMPAADIAQEESISREWVIRQHQEGKSMAGYDLSGLDLSDLDLRKADFGQATLSEVNFSNTRLDAAIFQNAILERADFTKANLSEANLRGVSAQAVRLQETNLTKASLREADFTESDFSHANLDTADLKSCVLSGARLQDARLTNAVGDKAQLDVADCSRCDFTSARFQGANFYGSVLNEACFKESDCRQSDFSAACASSARFESSNLSDSQADFKSSFDQAVFMSADLSGVNWHKVSLQACNFDRATMTGADLTGSNLHQAILIGAQAKNLCLDRCDLTEADLSGANLFEGSLRTSKLQNAKLIAANLFGADFLNAQLNGADWRDSIIARSLLEFRKP
jgi:uncharacterized protein YjbI with pentapeptide repeats